METEDINDIVRELRQSLGRHTPGRIADLIRAVIAEEANKDQPAHQNPKAFAIANKAAGLLRKAECRVESTAYGKVESTAYGRLHRVYLSDDSANPADLIVAVSALHRWEWLNVAADEVDEKFVIERGLA